MFQVKTFVSIVASMVNRMRRTTTAFSDYNPGSVARTIVEAPAMEIDELYQQMLQGLLDAIATSVYTSFNFAALPPAPASGLVRVSITPAASDTVIAANTLVTPDTGSSVYLSTGDVTIAAGNSYIDVPVAATVAGSAGNLPVDTTFTLSPAPVGFVSAVNLAAFINGADAETEAQRRTRFNGFISTLSRGTVAAILYGVLTTAIQDSAGNVIERVRVALVDEPYKRDNTQPTGLINVIVHNGVGATSAALVSQAQEVVDGYYDASGNPVPGWKAAGVTAVLSAATEVPITVIGVATVKAGYAKADVQTAVVNAINAYMLGLGANQPYEASVVAALVLAVPGVSNWIPSMPTVDVPAALTEKIMPGAVLVITTPLAGTMAITSAASGSLTK